MPTAGVWILAGGLFVTFCQALGQVVTTGRAFQLVRCSGINIPLYAGYAIGFRELARFLFKYSMVQLPLLISFTVASSIIIFHHSGLALTGGGLFGCRSPRVIRAHPGT